ncbi:MAG: hypothetical protein Tsb0034_19710 [Ekhidna sp.]
MPKSFCILWFILWIPLLTEGQTFSSKGRFSIEFDKGCAPFTVHITEHDTFGAVTRQYYYFEGADITNSTTFIYDSPGRYQIVQVVGVDNITDKTDTLYVEVVESPKPEVVVTRCSELSVHFESVDTYYDSIRVYFGGPDSVTLLTNQSTSFTFPSANTQTYGLKGFFDNADEVCISYFDEVIPLATLTTPTLQYAAIKESCKDVYALYLRLDHIDTLVNYRVYLEQDQSIKIYDGFVDSTFLVLPDINFELGDYCVSVELFDPCSGTTTISNEICNSPSNLSLSPFESLYSSYEGDNIYINLDLVLSGRFEIQRRFEGGDFEPRTTVTGSFNDPIGSITRKYFYKIDYVDSCENVLFSAETHPPHVETEEIEDNRYLVRFSPASHSLSEIPEVVYSVGNPGTLSTDAVSSSSFELRLNAADGAPRQFLTTSSTYPDGTILNSNTQILKYELVVYVPTAFTPNGDGLNDNLDFFGVPSDNAEIFIYSKWGQLIYQSTDVSAGWDGHISGKKAAEGTYLYEIVFETSDGKLLRQKGTFALINK